MHLKDKINVACNQLTGEKISSAINRELLWRAEACLIHRIN
jgi:hypothetical protein